MLTNVIDLSAGEFLFRGFLAHVGKPALEVFSTLAGGLIYGWLAWQTRSILWGTIGHVYILTLAILPAGAAAGSAPA